MSRRARISLPFAAVTLGLAACGGASPCRPAVTGEKPCTTPPCSPGPPDAGPGSFDYPHADVVVRTVTRAMLGAHSFTTYEPARPAPSQAPVVLFLHGYFDAEPAGIDAMLRHISRKGFTVVYPTFGVPWGPAAWEENAADALGAALESLEAPGRVRPDRSRVSFVGHSIGGLIALRLAQRAGISRDPRLPQPVAMVLLDAAGIATPAYPYLGIDDLSAVPPPAWLLVVMSEDSYLARRKDANQCRGDTKSAPDACNGFSVARKAFQGTPQISRDHKAAVVIPSDSRGRASLRSDHNAVIDHCNAKDRPIDAIDAWGYWKLTVAALTQATRGTGGTYAFGDTHQARDMGEWSDGHPVRPIVAIDECLLGGPCP